MSEFAWFVVAAVTKCIVAIVLLLTVFAYMTLIERRVIARFQSRVGPNRAGPLGLFQPIADALKMAFKEQITPARAQRATFLMAPAISIFVALSAFAVIPMGDTTTWGTSPIAEAWAPYVANINVGILYILSISSLAVYGIVLGGWSSGSHYSLLGALRSAAQMVSYEVSIGLALAGVLMFSGTLNMVGIVHAQVTQGIWFVLAQPLGFVLYAIGAVAEVNRAPFDLPEAEQELVAGYLTEFSGLRWSLFQMAEYVNMVTASSVLATLFFGGWTIGALHGILGAPFIWYAIKVAFFLFVFIWLRATLPRIRYDQLMRFGWQTLLPLSVLNALVAATVVAFDWPWWVAGITGLVLLVIFSAAYYIQVTRRATPPTTRGGMALPPSVKLVQVESFVVEERGADEAQAEPGVPTNTPTNAPGAAQPVERR